MPEGSRIMLLVVVPARKAVTPRAVLAKVVVPRRVRSPLSVPA
ncbi:hypothetical protein ACFY00_30275 [Kitasatospora sp. NPDC001540]